MDLNGLAAMRPDDGFFATESLWTQVMDDPDLSPPDGRALRGLMKTYARGLSTAGRLRRLEEAMRRLGIEGDLPSWKDLEEVTATKDPLARCGLPAIYKEEGWRPFRPEGELARYWPADREFLHHPQLDAWLSREDRAPIPTRVVAPPYRLTGLAAVVAPYALHRAFSATDRILFNAPKARLASDLMFSRAMAGEPVDVQETSYYAWLATNALAGWTYRHRDGSLLHDGASQFIRDDRYLSLAESAASNIVGVNVLALTADGYLLLQRQGSQNWQGGDSYVPTGSGSVDWIDVLRAGDGASLDAIVYQATIRELLEETALPDPSVVATFKWLGYTLEPTRGLKPEFYALATLSVTRDEVAERQESLEEFTHRQEAVPYDADLLRAIGENPALNEFLAVNLAFLPKDSGPIGTAI